LASKHECSLFAAVAAICACFDILLPARLGLTLAALVYLAWAAWLAKREAELALLTLNPLVCYQLWQALTLGVAPLYIAVTGPSDTPISLGNQLVPLAWVAYGHAVMVVGSCAFYAGLRRFKPRETVSERAQSREAFPLLLAAVVVVVGTLAHVARETVTELAGSTVAQLSLLPMALLSMVALTPRSVQRRSENTRFLILILGSLWLLFVNARRDSKMELMLSFFPLIWWLVRRKQRGLLLLTATGLAALYLIVIAPVVAAVRNDISARDETGTIRALTPHATGQIVAGLQENLSSSPVTYIQSWLDQTMLRTCDPVAAGLVASLVERDGLLLGSSLDYVLQGLVPRVLWPDKPYNNPGASFSGKLGMVSDSGVAYTLTGTTSAGELYWNFGWLGTLLGMYVLGAAVAFWWRAAGADPRRGLLEMTAYTGATLSFVLGTGAAAGPLLTTCISAGLFWRVLIALRRRMLRPKAARPGLRGIRLA
jgi:hypothetical protein